MEVLCHLEVLLRNAVDRQFPEFETGSDHRLTICRSEVWLCDPGVLTDESRERVNDAIGRLERQGKTPTRGRVVASLSFGFWSALFGKPYEELWRSTLASGGLIDPEARRYISALSRIEKLLLERP